MKDIITKINESSREVKFTVAFTDATDSEGIPFSVTVLVDPKNKDAFKKYLEAEKDNTVYMAEDWEGNPIGEK